MNLNNIYEGLIIKNYNELCELLEEPHKTGNARLAHFKQFDRYFSYKKDGHKIKTLSHGVGIVTPDSSYANFKDPEDFKLKIQGLLQDIDRIDLFLYNSNTLQAV